VGRVGVCDQASILSGIVSSAPSGAVDQRAGRLLAFSVSSFQ